MDILEFIIAHADTVFAIVGALVTVASLIVGLTPSHRDDEIVGIIRNMLERLSMLKHTEGVK